jgi:hypothetical protein
MLELPPDLKGFQGMSYKGRKWMTLDRFWFDTDEGVDCSVNIWVWEDGEVEQAFDCFSGWSHKI